MMKWRTTGADIINAGAGDNRILAGLSNDDVTTLGGTDVVLGDNGELTYSRRCFDRRSQQ